MKSIFFILAGLLGAATAGEERKMDRLMSMKTQQWDKMRAEGQFDRDTYKSLQRATPCVNGKAGEYACDNVDLLSFLSHQDMGSTTREGNDVWGWTSPDGREFGAVGQTDGTAFVEIGAGGALKYLGRLPTQTESSPWRDMKVINGYVYIGSEAPGHGLQIFDMRKLLNIRSPKKFDIRRDLTALFTGFGSSHNIVAHEETNMIYAVGTSRNLACAGGLFMVDVSNPAKPFSPGCASEDGYVHDAQCVFYEGPDTKYLGKEICFNYNEDTLTIMDVTDKKKPILISRTPYAGAAYTHQGWLTSLTDMNFLLLDDELDEEEGTGVAANGRTTTYVFNITSLGEPTNTGYYQSPAKSIDHNQYVLNGLSYQSNYNSGLRIVDISSVESDPSARGFKQAGFFDCHPEDDSVGGIVEFSGSWSVYPYFPSGYILLNSIERGLYSLKYTG
ncbi:MAG: hypothetical protein M1837_005425 [Sclerophora amabilis]|nr:MAG: hypothetical protein M1837_005425 [Sclerophora amabilis]